MQQLLQSARKFLFFTGKGGVGKTSMACSTAIGLADSGKKVLLISTDPASNLDEVLETKLASTPTAITGVDNLWGMNINPVIAAAKYKEKMVAPYRGVLPESAIEQMEEQLSGACTVEIAGFNEFARCVGDATIITQYDHIVLDTAPTGHTLRLLNLPAAWQNFIAENETGSSCLGPVSGLADQKILFDAVVASLKDPEQTLLVLVSRAESISLHEANRASLELGSIGIHNQYLVMNGLFTAQSHDPTAQAFEQSGTVALQNIPKEINSYPRTTIGFIAQGVGGIESIRALISQQPVKAPSLSESPVSKSENIHHQSIAEFLAPLKHQTSGVLMTMGKGGVGKTTIATHLAQSLAEAGHAVTLTTTDPAAHLHHMTLTTELDIRVESINPEDETERYVESVLSKQRGVLTAEQLALLEEELSSPCIEEIAVFQAFARTVAQGTDRFVVIDTAPTGHTLLLLDATQSYHKEISKRDDSLSEEVRNLLPRLRDPEFTKIVVVTLPEATPVHEAEDLVKDLKRADIAPYGWVINRSFSATGTTDPQLIKKVENEQVYISKVVDKGACPVLILPWETNSIANA